MHDRRRASALVVVLALGATAAPTAQAAVIEAYPTKISVLQGDTLALHVRSQVAAYTLSVWRQGQHLEPITPPETYAGQNFPVPADAWERDCGWPVTCRVPVPLGWRPGAYLACLKGGAYTAWIPFVVRARVPGSTALSRPALGQHLSRVQLLRREEPVQGVRDGAHGARL